ncbi:hypothetical protein L5M28_23295 [Shewanella sp. SW32]|jgi:hypothetical protein|uniref:hypothetical protein n=1 Tax=unclassified Shewanella TaxID=196818 RepID=UPI0021D7F9D3|nr:MULTISPECIES: hypothetical protein [unclassified Shewanella]MCU7965470.1 hypothetical protein [Shewanella sp. SW32]MCU7973519.1 hypothetical protein [Shewanella sp. SW29]MCU8045586.1 hypothetical protein [Shewanella sp. SM68]MCU8049897.1 hypothetical protein [Shewanella sp. SM65]
METTTRLSIHESLPFPAAYSTADGESVVTVNQDDLEAFVRTHNRLHKQLKISIFVVAVCVVAVLVGAYEMANLPSQVIYVQPK